MECFVPESTIPNDGVQQPREDVLIRFFMTGLNSAGKTTIIRQLLYLSKIRDNYKFCNENWQEEVTKSDDNDIWVIAVRKNILYSFDIFIKQLKQSNVQFDSKDDEKLAKYIEETCELGEEGIEDLEVTPEFTQGLIKLFQSKAIQNIWKKRNTICIDGKRIFDGAEHFMKTEKITEVFSSNYQASDADKLNIRKPTLDIQTYRFKINNSRIELTDVGGERSELPKIIDFLRNWSFSANDTRLNFILLIVPMSDFNVPHNEFEGTLLDECVEYMKILVNNPVAKNCGLFIFFNKKDRFKQKLQDPECRDDIKYLTTYLSPKDVEEFKKEGEFNERIFQKTVSDKFIEAIKSHQKNTHFQYTCAIDSELMEELFSSMLGL